MKQTRTNQTVMIFLASSVLAGLLAVLVATQRIHLVNFSFAIQLLFIGLIWLTLVGVFYAALSWSSKRSSLVQRLFTVDLSWNALFQKFFLAGLLLFPMSILLFVQARMLAQVLAGKSISELMKMAPTGVPTRLLFIAYFLLGVLLLLLIFQANQKESIRRFWNELPDRYYVFLIFLVSVLARIVFIQLVDTQPRSDFDLINKDALSLAQGLPPNNMYVSAHVAATLIYGLLYSVFGQNLIVLKLFHVIVYAVAGSLLYFTGTRVLENKIWAGLAGVLLASWPSLALYSNVLSPEHMFILMECALLFAVTWFFRRQEEHQDEKVTFRKEVPVFLLIGLLIGLAGLFRPFGQLFLAAFVIVLFLWKPRPMMTNLLGILLIVLLSWSLGKIPDAVAEAYNNHFPYIRPCNLLVGLNIDAAGRWNMDDYYLCKQIRTQSANQAEVSQRVMEIVLQRLQGKLNLFVPFLIKKFTVLWQNSTEIVFWTLPLDLREVSGSTLELAQKVNLLDFAMMLLGTLACLIGTVIAFFKDLKPVLFFGLVAFFGFNLMEILFEIQTRYRTVVMPLFIFFACWSLSALSLSVRKQKTAEQMSMHSSIG